MVVNYSNVFLFLILFSCQINEGNEKKFGKLKRVVIHDYLLDESRRHYGQPSFTFHVEFDEFDDYESLSDGFFISGGDTIFLEKLNSTSRNTFLYTTKGNRLWSIIDLKNVNDSSKEILENMSLRVRYKSKVIPIESNHPYTLSFIERPAIKINNK